MIFSLLYIVLAALGLGFLIFIHELGHYWTARREGMIVEIFSIGFGKALYTWEYQGVKWQFCVLPFGGYVRIAGMEKSGMLEPYQIPDGFYGKKPWSRIKVALSGPIVNIAFAFVAFLLLFLAGGRLKPFSEYTKIIGWVDSSSALYQAEIRPGDQIQQLNHRPFQQFQDLIYAAVLEDTAPEISGQKVDYFADQKTPFTFQFPLEPNATTPERISAVFSSFGPASYLIYRAHPALKKSPIQESGIAPNDRILWIDGEVLFSKEQMISVVNQSKALLTIQRNGEFFLTRVPRLKVSDLRINSAQKSELQDWQHAAKLPGKLLDLFFIPYNLTLSAVVEEAVTYLNEETMEQKPMQGARTLLEAPLLPGDRIVAVDGIEISSSRTLLEQLQTRHIQIIVKKNEAQKPVLWKDADAVFLKDIDWKTLFQMIHSIGTPTAMDEMGNLKRLKPVVPTQRDQYPYPAHYKEKMAKEQELQKRR